MDAIDDVVHIPVGSAESFLRSLDWVNKRAKRMGAKVRVEAEEIGREPRKVTVTRDVYEDGRRHRVTGEETRACVLFRVRCPEPIRLPGYRYAGTIAAKGAERDTATGEVAAHSFTPFPDAPQVPRHVIDRAFDAKGMMCCDHCGTFRNRRIGFVVVSDDGNDHKIVGSACVRDFLGHDPKVIVAHFQTISLLRREYDAQAKVGWYSVHEYDFAAEAKAREDARARRDAKTYSLRAIVGACLYATAEQGYFVRFDGPGKRATAARVLELLADPPPEDHSLLGNLDAVLEWARAQGWPDTDGPMALGAYKALDPDFRVADAYRRATGEPLIGRFHRDPEAPIRLTCLDVSRRGISVDTQYGPRQIVSPSYRFADRAGSTFVWTTQSAGIAAQFAPGRQIDATFEVRRGFVEDGRAVNVVRRMKFVPVPGREPPEEGTPGPTM